MSTRIVILDDHEILAQSLATSLRLRGFDVTAMAVGPLDEIRGQLTREPPDVLLLDLQLGDVGHGLELVRPLTEAGVRVVILSGVTDRWEIGATLEAGAVGFVSKSNALDTLLDAAVCAARGEQVTPTHVRQELLAELRRHRAEEQAAREMFQRLTGREQQVLERLCAGQSVSAIASDWVVSVTTVRSQVRSILLKLQARSQLEAVATAVHAGWYATDSEGLQHTK